jgi:hypothetical protein
LSLAAQGTLTPQARGVCRDFIGHGLRKIESAANLNGYAEDGRLFWSFGPGLEEPGANLAIAAGATSKICTTLHSRLNFELSSQRSHFFQGAPFMNAHRFVAALSLLTLAAPVAAAVTQTTYQINAGGQYEYKPSPWVGIPGGVPSPYELDFGIGGTFVYELDTTAETARLLNLNLFLTGNEPIQAAPPDFTPVTADRVETYLANQLFVEDFIGGLLHLESSTVPGLKLTDGLNGNIAITGGFDMTPVDGHGMQFQFSAHAIPEPSCFVLLATAAACIARRRR